MIVISSASQTILNILNGLKKADGSLRLTTYCVEAKLNDGVLLFQLLTRELVFLSWEEYENIYDNEYLRSMYFLVPQNTKEKELADFIKFFLNTRQKKPSHTTGYTIFTTTDCNARCFYCFELGRSRNPMSHDTALKSLQYIKDHCGDNAVRFRWFGGEPLMNYEVIDTICNGLRDAGIPFSSSMVSNGYLFSDELVEKAANSWNIKWVQITLDGTESIYNKVKAYVYKEGNPFQIVMDNIERLLNASIHVQIRLNMDLHNAEDLLTLATDLAIRFNGRKNLNVYAHHLFKAGVPMAEMHTDEEWEVRGEAMRKIEDVLKQSGLMMRAGISKTLQLHHCMADSGSDITILPDGSIGLCEHHLDDEFIGHLDRDHFDQKVISSWKERVPAIPECSECFYYPECIKLKKCSNTSVCYPQYRESILRKTQNRMIVSYEKWLQKTAESYEETFEFEN